MKSVQEEPQKIAIIDGVVNVKDSKEFVEKGGFPIVPTVIDGPEETEFHSLTDSKEVSIYKPSSLDEIVGYVRDRYFYNVISSRYEDGDIIIMLKDGQEINLTKRIKLVADSVAASKIRKRTMQNY